MPFKGPRFGVGIRRSWSYVESEGRRKVVCQCSSRMQSPKKRVQIPNDVLEDLVAAFFMGWFQCCEGLIETREYYQLMVCQTEAWQGELTALVKAMRKHPGSGSLVLKVQPVDCTMRSALFGED